MIGAFFVMVVLLQTTTEINGHCRELNDVYFRGIYGNLNIRAHKCDASTSDQVKGYFENIRNDALMTVLNTDFNRLSAYTFPNKSARNIITLTMINCSIQEIDLDSIVKFEKLYNLTLSGNNFKSFSSNYIKKNNYRFRHLNLTNNNIREVSNLCSGLPTLKQIVLRDNPIRSIDSIVFSNCINLEYLDLSGASLSSIYSKAFANTKKLNVLLLANNNIDKLDNVYFNLDNLTALDLSKNVLSEFSTKLFNFYPNLRVLNLGSNQINKLNNSFNLSENFDLRSLYLNNNNLSSINLTYFSELQTLDLSYNKLNELPVHVFEHSIELQHLLLSHNNISSLPTGLFSPVTNLVRLDISYNRISSFNEQLLLSLVSLEEIDVSGNLLSTNFDSYFFMSHLEYIKKIGIADLYWPCENVLWFIRSCKSRNIDCASKVAPNYKKTNIQGIECIEEEKNETEKAYVYQVNDGQTYEKLLNLSTQHQSDQNYYFQLQVLELHKLNVVIILAFILILLYVCVNALCPPVQRFYAKYRSEGIMIKSRAGDNSTIELLNPDL